MQALLITVIGVKIKETKGLTPMPTEHSGAIVLNHGFYFYAESSLLESSSSGLVACSPFSPNPPLLELSFPLQAIPFESPCLSPVDVVILTSSRVLITSRRGSLSSSSSSCTVPI